MTQQKKKLDKRNTAVRMQPSVVIHASPMDKQQEQRLNTAVDALLAEMVRQQMSRGKQQ
jgi:hypothetical protein